MVFCGHEYLTDLIERICKATEPWRKSHPKSRVSDFFQSRSGFAVPKFSRAKIYFVRFFFFVGPKLGEDQKKKERSSLRLGVFFAQNQVKIFSPPKKKVFSPPIPMDLVVFSKEPI